MTPSLVERGVRAVLLDIEGTTTPISFVHDVLFPFARAHVDEFVHDRANAGIVRDAARLLVDEHAADDARGEALPIWRLDHGVPTAEALIAYLLWLMDRDRKSPGLKLLQGFIWERGYQAGQLRGIVFPDVVPAIRGWRAAGIDVAIYSSGSELAQRRLFESTEHGDLTPLLCGFFDTRVGAKTSPDSYLRIAASLGRAPHEVLFVSDIPAEVTAATAAGMQGVLRGSDPLSTGFASSGSEVVYSFDQLAVDGS